MKGMKGTVDIHIDLEDFAPDLDYPFEDLIKYEVSALVREDLRRILQGQMRKAYRKWLKDEFLAKGELQIREGAVTIPLMLDAKDLKL